MFDGVAAEVVDARFGGAWYEVHLRTGEQQAIMRLLVSLRNRGLMEIGVSRDSPRFRVLRVGTSALLSLGAVALARPAICIEHRRR